jgi:hypothetical protein
LDPVGNTGVVPGEFLPPILERDFLIANLSAAPIGDGGNRIGQDVVREIGVDQDTQVILIGWPGSLGMPEGHGGGDGGGKIHWRRDQAG